jgi:hypothetical protein
MAERESRVVGGLKAGYRTGRFITGSATRSFRGRSQRFPEIPTRVPGPGVAAAVLVDELMMVGFPAIATPKDPAERERVREQTNTAVNVLHDRGWYGDPTTYHRNPSAPTYVESQRRNYGHIRHELVTFDSEFEPAPGLPGGDEWLSFTNNRLAGGYVMRHRGGPRPWLVSIHGYTAGAPSDLLAMRALHYHRTLGFNVFHPVMPFHGFRRSGRRNGSGLLSYDHVHNLHAYSQTVWDIRKCIAWVRAQDTPSVALHGISLGGLTASVVASLENPPDRVVAGIPFVDVARLTAARFPASHRPTVELDGDYEAIYHLISPTALECQVPHDRRFVYGGVADRITTAGQAVELWRHWDRPAACWFKGGHVGALVSSEVRRFIASAITGDDRPPVPA